MSSNALRAAAPTMPGQANGKAGAAPPKITAENNVELDSMDAPENKLPLHEDIMQLARLGEIGPVQKLLEEKRVDANYRDQEGITPLHVRWTRLWCDFPNLQLTRR